MATNNERVLITGGTGLVGRKLIDLLLENGFKVSILSRSKQDIANVDSYLWNVKKKTIDEEAVTTAHHIVHLAGAGIADKRWTKERKEVLRSSRLDSLDLIYSVLKEQEHRVKSLVSASAIGYYGNAGDKILTEDSSAGGDFAAKLCADWESKAREAESYNLRAVQVRVGLVMSLKGGALPKLLTTYPLALSYFGNGSQYQSWIHIEDLARIFLHAIENDGLRGPYNAVGPEPVTQKELMKSIKKSGSAKPLLLPAPPIGIRLALGEMADIVLASQRCSASKIIATGFEHKYSTADACFADLLAKN